MGLPWRPWNTEFPHFSYQQSPTPMKSQNFPAYEPVFMKIVINRSSLSYIIR